MRHGRRSGWDALFATAPLPILLLFAIPYLLITGIIYLVDGISESFSNHYEKSKTFKQTQSKKNQLNFTAKYIGNKKSATFHNLECKWAKQTSKKNMVLFEFRMDAIKFKMKPCRFCKP
jgi:hypothetical protein